MRLDFSKIKEAQDFPPLPDGEYLCRVNEIEHSATLYGTEVWILQLGVLKGKFIGRHIFSEMRFSVSTYPRVKLICFRLGLDVSGEIDLTPDLLKGRECYISVGTEEYTTSEGKIKKRNAVFFGGYERIDAPAV